MLHSAKLVRELGAHAGRSHPRDEHVAERATRRANHVDLHLLSAEGKVEHELESLGPRRVGLHHRVEARLEIAARAFGDIAEELPIKDLRAVEACEARLVEVVTTYGPVGLEADDADAERVDLRVAHRVETERIEGVRFGLRERKSPFTRHLGVSLLRKMASSEPRSGSGLGREAGAGADIVSESDCGLAHASSAPRSAHAVGRRLAESFSSARRTMFQRLSSNAGARGGGSLTTMQDRGDVVRFERRHAGDALVERDARRPDVRASICGRAADLLGCHIVWCPDKIARRRESSLARSQRDAEVDQLRLLHAAFAANEKDVVRLDVSVDDAGVVNARESVEHGEDERDRVPRFEATMCAETVAERAPSSSSIT